MGVESCALPISLGSVGGVVRAGTWFGAGHRGTEQSQPAGSHRECSGDAVVQFWIAGGSLRGGSGDRSRAAEWTGYGGLAANGHTGDYRAGEIGRAHV